MKLDNHCPNYTILSWIENELSQIKLMIGNKDFKNIIDNGLVLKNKQYFNR